MTRQELEDEVAHLRFVEENLRERVAAALADRSRAQLSYDVMFSLWERAVRPGWRCWRIKRRWTARRQREEQQ